MVISSVFQIEVYNNLRCSYVCRDLLILFQTLPVIGPLEIDIIRFCSKSVSFLRVKAISCFLSNRSLDQTGLSTLLNSRGQVAVSWPLPWACVWSPCTGPEYQVLIETQLLQTLTDHFYIVTWNLLLTQKTLSAPYSLNIKGLIFSVRRKPFGSGE